MSAKRGNPTEKKMTNLLTLAGIAMAASVWTLLVFLLGWAAGRTEDGEDE